MIYVYVYFLTFFFSTSGGLYTYTYMSTCRPRYVICIWNVTREYVYVRKPRQPALKHSSNMYMYRISTPDSPMIMMDVAS